MPAGDTITVHRYGRDPGGEIHAETTVYRPAQPWEQGVSVSGLPGTWVVQAVVGQLPPGVVEVSQAQYAAQVTQRRNAAEAARQRAAQDDAAAAEAAHRELVAAGISPATAARLTGHRGGGDA